MPLLLSVQQLLLARVGNNPLALRLLAREFARAADCFRLFSVFAFRRLFIRAPLPHLTKYNFTLHFLFQNTKSLIHIVVDAQKPAIDVPLSRGVADSGEDNPH